MKKIARLSKKEGIYSNKDLNILFAIFPSTLPFPFCITNGITFPISVKSFAFVSSITFFINERTSSSDINLVVSKSNGDRKILLSELNKLEYYSKNGKKITTEHIMKLTNLIENFSISELVDNCLANNIRKTKNILIENNFGNEDCVLIIRTFLNKLKRILKLCAEFQENKDIDLTITSAKPPIFWKDKDITKQQILRWSPNEIKEIIYKLYNIELMVKKNFGNSINLTTDFILNQISSKTSN